MFNLKAAVKVILFEVSKDKEKFFKIRRERRIILLSFAMIYTATILFLDPLLTESEATTYEGILSDVYVTRRYKGITLTTEDSDVHLTSKHTADFYRDLESYIGSEIKVWAYTRLNIMLLPEKAIIQIEINDYKRIRDWDSAAANSSKSLEIFIIALAFMTIVFKIRTIQKIDFI